MSARRPAMLPPELAERIDWAVSAIDGARALAEAGEADPAPSPHALAAIHAILRLALAELRLALSDLTE
ncbi:MAG: hypothetical protein HYZ28_08010 [Myxococcales bacterium]|nr:hypothetical protein [Myxococcales bacterium]